MVGAGTAAQAGMIDIDDRAVDGDHGLGVDRSINISDRPVHVHR